MLYKLYEMQHMMLAPMGLTATALEDTLSHPLSPAAHLPGAKAMAASMQMFGQLMRRYGKPGFDLPTTSIRGEEVEVTETVAMSKTFCDLLHFDRACEADDPRVLVVAPMSGHYATLLRGTIEALLPDHDLYITDWHNAREIPESKGSFGLEDYIQYIMHFLQFLGPKTHVIAVCQPSVPVLAAVSLMSEDKDRCVPASMTLMGGPIDTRINPTKVNRVAEEKDLDWFRTHAINTVPYGYAGQGRKVYPGFLQLGGFMSLNINRHVGAHFDYFNSLVAGDGDSVRQHNSFYDEFMSVMDLSEAFYLDTLKTVFIDHLLPRGRMTWRGRRVNPQAITKTALLTVEGGMDTITGNGQTEAAHTICDAIPANKKKGLFNPDVGHYGIFNGRRWREEIKPVVTDFIRTHGG